MGTCHVLLLMQGVDPKARREMWNFLSTVSTSMGPHTGRVDGICLRLKGKHNYDHRLALRHCRTHSLTHSYMFFFWFVAVC